MVAIIRRSPGRALTLAEPFYRRMNLLDEAEMLVREIWDAWPSVTFHTTFTARLEMYEEKEGLVIKTELPGIKKEDLKISLKGDMLTIEAEKKQEDITEDTRYYAHERHFGHYSRSVLLPTPVATDKVSATFEGIRLPKTEETKPKHVEAKVESPKPKRPRARKTKSK